MSVDCAPRGERARCRWLLGLLGLALASANAATAHPQFGPATINRYGRLVLTAPDRARLFYTVMVGDIPALRLRQSADADHNGQLDAAEQAALQAEIAAQVQRGLSLQLGPHLPTLRWESAQLALGEATVSARALSFDAVAIGQPDGTTAAHSPLRYQDRVKLPPVGEVELRIDEAPSVWLRQSRGPTIPGPSPTAAGPGSAEPRRLFQAFGPPPGDAIFTVELDVAARDTAPLPPAIPPTRRSPPLLTWLLGLGLLVLLALCAARVATRRAG